MELERNRIESILIIYSRIPYPLVGGDRIRIYNTARILSRKYKVDLLCVNEGRIKSEHLARLKEVFDKVICFSYYPLRFKWNVFKGLLSKEPLQVSYYYFKEIQRWVNENYKGYNLVFCNHIRTVKYIEGMACAKIVDLHDAISMNYVRAKLNAKGWWRFIYSIESKKLLPYEIKTVDEFNKSFIVSDKDRNYLIRSGARAEKIVTIPVAVKEEVLARSFDREPKYHIAFLGKMDYRPNADAVFYFVKNVFPKLKKNIRELRFVIIGAKPPKIVSELSKIEGI